jgi:hypothetical protein
MFLQATIEAAPQPQIQIPEFNTGAAGVANQLFNGFIGATNTGYEALLNGATNGFQTGGSKRRIFEHDFSLKFLKSHLIAHAF